MAKWWTLLRHKCLFIIIMQGTPFPLKKRPNLICRSNVLVFGLRAFEVMALIFSLNQKEQYDRILWKMYGVLYVKKLHSEWSPWKHDFRKWALKAIVIQKKIYAILSILTRNKLLGVTTKTFHPATKHLFLVILCTIVVLLIENTLLPFRNLQNRAQWVPN